MPRLHRALVLDSASPDDPEVFAAALVHEVDRLAAAIERWAEDEGHEPESPEAGFSAAELEEIVEDEFSDPQIPLKRLLQAMGLMRETARLLRRLEPLDSTTKVEWAA